MNHLCCGLQTGQLLQSPFSGSMFVFQGAWPSSTVRVCCRCCKRHNRETFFGFCVVYRPCQIMNPNPKRPSSDGFFMFLEQRHMHINDNLKRRGEAVHFGYCARRGVFLELAWKQTWYQPELTGHEMSLYVYVCRPWSKFVHDQGRSMDRLGEIEEKSRCKHRAYVSRNGIMEFATARHLVWCCFAGLRPDPFQGKPVLRRAEAQADHVSKRWFSFGEV